MRWPALLAVPLAGVLAAGCGGERELELQPGVLRIGVVTPHDSWGGEIVNGVRAAVRELDRDGGIDGKVRVQLLFGDSRRLAAARVRVVILSCGERAQAAAARIAARRRALMLEPCNTGVWRRFAEVWPISASPRQEADALAAYVADQKYERVALVGDGGIEASFRRGGVRFASARHADAVAVVLPAPRAQAAVTRLRVRGIAAPVVATHGMDDRRAVADHRSALEGVTFTTFGYPEPGDEMDEFYERYRALTGRVPDGSFAALGYDAIRVLDAAVNEAESTEPRAVAAVMPGLDASGATGMIRYPERGGRNPAVSLALVRIEDGRLVLVDRVDV